MPGWSLCFLSTKPVLWELSRGYFKCRTCFDIMYIAAIGFHPPFLWLRGLPWHHHLPYTGVVPIFYLFHLFSILEQELSFNYDSSSLFLTLNLYKNYILLQVFTDYMYILLVYYFVTFFPVTFFPSTTKAHGTSGYIKKVQN